MLFLPLEFDKENGSTNLIVAVKLETEMVPQNLLILLYFVKDLDQKATIWFHGFVLQVDYEMGLEYATQTGVNEEPREDIYIQSLDEDKNFIDFQSPIFVFRLYH